jgi:uncharacterized protein YbaR (Trm112 family)
MTLGRTCFGLTRSTSLIVLILSPRPSVRRSTDPYAHTELRGLTSSHTHPSAALNPSSAGSSSPSSSGTIYPTYVLPASITTIHPQLRDLLVCPKERGRLYYVQGKGITELRVDLEGEREYGEQVREGKAVVGEWAPKVSSLPVSRWSFSFGQGGSKRKFNADPQYQPFFWSVADVQGLLEPPLHAQLLDDIFHPPRLRWSEWGVALDYPSSRHLRSEQQLLFLSLLSYSDARQACSSHEEIEGRFGIGLEHDHDPTEHVDQQLVPALARLSRQHAVAYQTVFPFWISRERDWGSTRIWI